VPLLDDVVEAVEVEVLDVDVCKVVVPVLLVVDAVPGMHCQ